MFSVKESGKYQGAFFISCECDIYLIVFLKVLHAWHLNLIKLTLPFGGCCLLVWVRGRSTESSNLIGSTGLVSIGVNLLIFAIFFFSRKDLSFSNTMHLHNPWNENKPVKIGRDGQASYLMLETSSLNF